MQLRLRDGEVGCSLIEVALRQDVRADERLGPRRRRRSPAATCASARATSALAAFHRDGERTLVDREEQVALS